MKKIYISADIEGIWGNSNPKYTMVGTELYEEYRANMINEVNLVIDILFKNGVEEILVNDGHGNMDNLLPSKLDKRVRFVTSNGAYKEFGMMEGLDESFDGVCFIGYHSRSNTQGVMAHTIWGTMVRSISIDQKEVGESGINAYLSNELNVPIILVSGDDKLHEQIKEEIGYEVEFVETKKAVNNQCAICKSYNELIQNYEISIKNALAKDYFIKGEIPCSMDITFHHIRNADFVSRLDEVERIDDCTIRIRKDNYRNLYKMMRFVIKVCNAFA